jgi:hypothetical protein
MDQSDVDDKVFYIPIIVHWHRLGADDPRRAILAVVEALDDKQWQRLYMAVETWCVALTMIFQRRYFTRRWVVQELYHSNRMPPLIL